MAGTVFFYEGALKRLLEGPDGPVARDLVRRATRVESRAKLIATGAPRVQTGRYRTSIGYRVGRDKDGLFAEIGSQVPYAIYLEEGTRPHEIRPKNKRALWWPTARHPVRLVRHPGTRAYHVMRRALRIAG